MALKKVKLTPAEEKIERELAHGEWTAAPPETVAIIVAAARKG